MAFSGEFAHRLVSCLLAGDNSEAGLRDASNLNDQLGEEGWQHLVDLLLSPHPAAEKLGYEYPYLALAITAWDRGTFTLQGERLASDDERFTQLQTLLEATDPRYLAQLLLHWHNQGQLQPLINQWLRWVDQLPEGSLAGLTRQTLTNDRYREHLLTVARQLLSQPEVQKPINRLLTPATYPLPTSALTVDSEPAAELPERTGWQHWLAYWQSQSTAAQQRLVTLISGLVSESLDLEADTLSYYGQNLGELSFDWLHQHQQPLAALATWGEPLTTLQLDELNPLMLGLEAIATNPLYIDTLQEKAGASRLQLALEETFWTGGTIPNCQGLVLSGMESASSAHTMELQARQWLSPHRQCRGLSPLVAVALAELGADCDADCLAAAADWLQPQPGVRASRDVLTSLLNYATDRLVTAYQQDPYVLQHHGLAFGRLSAQQLKALTTLIDQATVNSPADLLDLERHIREHPDLRSQLQPDFLSQWLAQTIARLDVSAYQLGSWAPAADESLATWLTANHDRNLLRSLVGWYEGGPASSRLFELITQEELEVENPANTAFAQRLKQGLSLIHGAYRNPQVSFKGQQERFQLPWTGSRNNRTLIDAQGRAQQQARPLTYADALYGPENADEPQGLLLADRLARQIPLLSTTDKKPVANRFRNALTALAEQRRQPPTSSPLSPALPPELFKGPAPTAAQARLVILFLGQNLFPEAPLAEGTWRPKADAPDSVFARDEAPRLLAGTASISGRERAWSGMVRWLPAQFGEHRDFANWPAPLIPDATTLQTWFEQRLAEPLVVEQGHLATSPVSPGEPAHNHEKLLGVGQMLATIYQSQTRQIAVPAIGFAAYCPTRQGDRWQATGCPLQAPDYPSYVRFIQQRFQAQMCPVLMLADEPRRQRWLESLNFQQSPPDVARLCQPYRRDPALPAADLVRIIDDVFGLGPNPQLSPAIRSLPLQMTALKAAATPNPQRRRQLWRQLLPTLQPQLSARTRQRQETAWLLQAGESGLFDHVVQQAGGLMGDQQLAARLKTYGKALTASESPYADFLLATVDEFQIARAQGRSLLGFGHQWLGRMQQNPEHFTVMQALAAHPRDSYTGILLGFTLGQALDAGVFTDFSPEQPGYSWLLQTLSQDQWQLVTGFGEMLGADIAALSQTTAEHMLAAAPETSTFAQDVQTGLNWLLPWLSQQDQLFQTGLDLRQVAGQLDASTLAPALSELWLTTLNRPLADLDNQWHPALRETLPELLTTSFADLPELADQTLAVGSGEPTAAAFGPKLVWGLTQGLAAQDGSRELFRLLQDERLGLRAVPLLRSLVEQPALFQKVSRLLDHVAPIPARTWQAGFSDMETLVQASYKFLDFTAHRTQWRASAPVEYRYAFATIGRFAQSARRRETTFQLLETWFTPRPASDSPRGDDAHKP
jgi:hypothetical protein